MPTVDRRVVEMQFVNKDFEKGVAESLKSLEALRKKSEDLDKMSNSLESLEKTARGFNISAIGDGVSAMANKLTVLGKVADKVKDKIASLLVDTGEKAFKAVAGLEAMESGFDKYAIKTKATQTILHATGEDMSVIQEVLGNLMHYTDETSYSFTEMVKTIGKFTASGVKLQEAELAMEGIGNAAALAGADIQQANHVMYNLAQALSAGYVKQQDWMSVNTAGMSTKQFKEELIKTAIAMGTLKKQSETAGYIISGTGKKAKKTAVNFQSFESTLKDGWLTSKVLIETLNRYAKDQTAFEAAKEALTYKDAIQAIEDAISSSWMQTMELLFGGLDESIILWTKVCNSVIEFIDIFNSWRNSVLESWRANDGYTNAIEIASNVWHTFMNVVYAVKDVLAELFPADLGKGLADITAKVKEASESWRKFFGYPEEHEYEDEVETVVSYAQKLSNVLKQGMRGDEVKTLQEQLIKAGFNLDKFGADGIYGPETKKAIMALQKQLGVAQTGMWDKETRAAARANKMFREVTKSTITYTKEEGEVGKGTKIIQDGIRIIVGFVKGLGNAIGFVGKLIIDIFNLISKPIDAIGTVLVSAGKSINDFFTNMKEGKNYATFFEKISNFLKPITDRFDAMGKSIKSLFVVDGKVKNLKEFFKSLKDRAISNFMNKGDKRLLNIVKAFNAAKGVLKKVWNFIVKIGKAVAALAGGAVIALFNWLTTELPKIVINAARFIGSLIQAVKHSETLKNIWEKIKSFVSNVWKTAKDLAGSLFGDLSSSDLFSWDERLSFGDNLKKKLKNYIVHPFETAIKSIQKALQDLYNKSPFIRNLYDKIIKPTWEKISEFVSRVGEAIKNFFGTDTSDIEGFVPKLKKRLEAFNPIVEWFGDLGKKIFKADKRINNASASMLGAFQNGGTLEMLFERASEIGEVIKGFDVGKLIGPALIGVGLLMALTITKAIKNIGQSFTLVGTGIKGLTDAASSFIGTDTIGGIIKNFTTSLTESIAKRPKDSIGTTMLKFAGSIALIAGAVALLSIIDVDRAYLGMEVAVALIAAMAGAMYTLSKYGNDVGSIGRSMLEMAASIAVLAVGVWMMKGVVENTDGWTLLKSLGVISLLLIELGVISAIIGKNNKGFGVKINGVLAMCAGVLVLVWAIKSMVTVIQNNDEKTTNKAIAVIAGLLLELGIIEIVIAWLSKGNKVKIGGVLGMCFGVLLLARAIAKIAKDMKKHKNYDKALDVVKSLLRRLGIIEVAIAKIAGGKGSVKIGGVLSLCIGVGILALALGKIAEDYDKYPNYLKAFELLKSALMTFSASLLMASVAIKILSSIPLTAGIKGLAVLGIFVAGLGVFSALFAALDSLVAYFGGDLMGFLTKGANDIGRLIGAFFSGIFDPFNEKKKELKQTKSLTEVVSDLADGLSEVFDHFEPLLNKVQNITSAQTWGMAKFIGILAMASGENMLDSLSAITSKLASNGESSGSGFVDFANNLVKLITPLATFSTDVAKVNIAGLWYGGHVLDALGTLAGLSVIVSWNELVENILSAFRGESNLISFAKDLVALAPWLILYSSLITNVNHTAISNSAAALEALGDAGNAVPKIEGWAQAIGGTHDVGDFGKRLGALGRGLKAFYDETAGIPESYNAAGSVEALKGLAAMAVIVPRSGGMVQSIIGDKNAGLSQFSNGLFHLGKGLFNYYAYTKDIPDTYTSTGAIEALKGLAALATIVPRSGGLVQSIFGDKNTGLSNFASGLDTLGRGLLYYYVYTKDIPDSYTSSGPLEALKGLNELAKIVPRSGGIVQVISGDQNAGLMNFASGLDILGKGLLYFYVYTKDIPTDFTGDHAIAVLRALNAFSDELTRQGGTWEKFVGEKDIGKFGEDLGTLGDNLKSFYDNTKSINFNKIGSLGTALDKLAGAFSHVPDETTASMAFASYMTILSQIVNDGGYYDTFSKVGELIDENIASGISRQSHQMMDAIGRAVSYAGIKARSYYSSFVSVGSYLASGLAEGIYRNGKAAIWAANALANSVRNAIANIWKVRSPSRVGMWMGEMFDAGIMNGIINMTSSVAQSGSDLAKATLDATKAGLATFSQSLIEDPNMAPTIRPVLDLSEVQAGAGGIGSYFRGQTIGVNSTNMAGRISRTDAENAAYNSANTNADLGAQILALNERINQLDTTIANMKVVTETGALIGAIGPGIDSYLGKRQMMGKRGS